MDSSRTLFEVENPEEAFNDTYAFQQYEEEEEEEDINTMNFCEKYDGDSYKLPGNNFNFYLLRELKFEQKIFFKINHTLWRTTLTALIRRVNGIPLETKSNFVFFRFRQLTAFLKK